MKTYASSPHSAARGQSLVEFAISLTFMLILLSGAVYFGIGLFYYVAMRDAAQEGALFGSMNPDNTNGIKERVRNAAGSTGIIRELYDANDLNVTITYIDAACEGGGIEVTLEHYYSLSWLPIGAFIEPFVGPNIRLRATVTDTILTPPCDTP